jgi:hypothetical protein
LSASDRVDWQTLSFPWHQSSAVRP